MCAAVVSTPSAPMTPSSLPDARTARLPWLLLLFIGSGAAALIY